MRGPMKLTVRYALVLTPWKMKISEKSKRGGLWGPNANVGPPGPHSQETSDPGPLLQVNDYFRGKIVV